MKKGRNRRLLTTAGMVPAATVTTALVSPTALGASGDLDPSFGDVGRLGPILNGPIWSLEPQTDGSTLLGGGGPGFFYWGDWYGVAGFVGRVSESAVPDALLFPIEFDNTQIIDVVRQPDDYIVAVGRHLVSSEADTRLIVVRLHPDGTRDRAFGTDGEFRLSTEEHGFNHYATSAVLDPEGRIVVAGSRDDMLIVLRLTPDGVLDNSFATAGIFEGPANINRSGGRAGARTSLLRTDSGGYRVTASAADGCQVVALTADGAVDASFGDTGVAAVPTAAGSDAYCQSMDSHPDGRLLVTASGNDQGFVARLMADGKPDSTFNSAAVSAVMTDATAVAADGNSAVVVAGVADDGPAVIRLTANGSFDVTFGDAGIATFGLKSEGTLLPIVNDLLVGADRNILGAGGTCAPDYCWWYDQGFVIRLLGNGGESPGIIGFADQFDVLVEETDGEVVVDVMRIGGRNGSVGVTWNTVTFDDATAGLDFIAGSGTLTWADGDVAPQQIRVPVLADNDVEEYERFNIVLGSLDDGAGLGKYRAPIAIAPDGAPHGQFGVAWDVESSEFQPARVYVQRNFYFAGAVSVTATPVSGTAVAGVDFLADPIVLTWADGDSDWKEALVPIVADDLREGNETFSVVLSNPTGGAIIGPHSSATVLIRANTQGQPARKSGGGALGWLSLLALGLLRLFRCSSQSKSPM